MKISLNWIKDYINLDLDADQIAEYLTNTGLEVEGIEEIENIKGGLKGVVIGEVLTCEKHPNADRLSRTTVDIGENVPLNIVCGAPNVAVGQKVPVAKVGTVLYDGEESFKIKKSKIRGEVSEGMICAEDELGIGSSHEGIMVLDNNAKIGTQASDYFKIENDTVFEIGLTPNRSDAMSHIGVARDLKAVLNYNDINTTMCLPSVKKFKSDNNNLKIDVEVKDSKLCPRYAGVTLQGVNVKESPEWLLNKLKSIGLSPINNVVDITNYILHETGQPLHAFDAKKIDGSKVVVKTVNGKTKFNTLDEVERALSSEDLMICSEKKPMCIAGVFGGLDAGVTNETTDIFLESAYFDPISIRKTAKRHDLSTDASFRFERGGDPNMVIYALKRSAMLIKEIAGGKISSDISDDYPNKIDDFDIRLEYKNIDDLVGEKITKDSIKSILKDLEINVISSNSDGLDLRVPLFRNDVRREIDVIEEILRIYGFNSIKMPSKLNTSIVASNDLDDERLTDIISNLLSNNGFNEIMNNSLTKKNYIELIDDLQEDKSIRILNPLSKELNILRQSMLFGALESVIYNHNRRNLDLKLYEFGKTYHKINELMEEKTHLFLCVSGRRSPEIWNASSDNVDFFFIKQKVEHILNQLGILNFKSSILNDHGISEGLSYSIKKERLVAFGQLNHKILTHFGIKQDVYVADFSWDVVLNFINCNSSFSAVSKFPSVRRDLSLILPEDIDFDSLRSIAIRIENKILRSINLFDVYQGKNIPSGKKSYALSFQFADKNKTLTDKLIDRVMEKLMKAYEKIGADVRKN